MTWVKQAPQPDPHVCEPPKRESRILPCRDVDGRFGDLWRCDECSELWRVGNNCDACDPAPPGRHRCRRGGYHPSGLRWRPATWWQRLTNRRPA